MHTTCDGIDAFETCVRRRDPASKYGEHLMKIPQSLIALSIAIRLLTVGGFAVGQYRDGVRHADATSYGVATVLSAAPAWETFHTGGQQQVCDDDGYYRRDNESKKNTGTVIGAIVGGALGNTVGKGDGRKAATIAGAVAGGAIGRHAASDGGGSYGANCHYEDTDREERRPAGFDVEYNYKGDVYVTRMSYDPGNRVRVRVTVVPEDRGRPSGY